MLAVAPALNCPRVMMLVPDEVSNPPVPIVRILAGVIVTVEAALILKLLIVREVTPATLAPMLMLSAAAPAVRAAVE